MDKMSSFTQRRDGRTNIKRVSDSKNNIRELEKDEDDEEGMILDEEDWEQPNQSEKKLKKYAYKIEVLSVMVPLN